MYTKWTQHLRTKADQDNFEKKVLNAKDVLDRLKAILDEAENNLDTQENSLSDFDTPNWANKQAFRNGSKAALRNIKKLISLNKTDQSK